MGVRIPPCLHAWCVMVPRARVGFKVLGGSKGVLWVVGRGPRGPVL